MTIVIRIKERMTEEQEQWFHTILNDFESWGIDIVVSVETEQRPEVVFLKDAASIMVTIGGKKYIYNIFDLPRR